METTRKTTSANIFGKSNCDLCGAEMHHYEGNNPYPIGDDGDKCCNICNSTQVIPERLGLKGKEREEYVKQVLASIKRGAA